METKEKKTEDSWTPLQSAHLNSNANNRSHQPTREKENQKKQEEKSCNKIRKRKSG